MKATVGLLVVMVVRLCMVVVVVIVVIVAESLVRVLCFGFVERRFL